VRPLGREAISGGKEDVLVPSRKVSKGKTQWWCGGPKKRNWAARMKTSRLAATTAPKRSRVGGLRLKRSGAPPGS
jgi:hypothetical protein